MGYTHGVKWTDEEIEEQLNKYFEKTNNSYFPTHTELDAFYGNKGLSKAVTTHGGNNCWAAKMDKPIKLSETSFGSFYENIAIEEIRENVGLDAEYTNSRYPYDILVDRSVKVDVKASKLYHKTEYGYSCTFNLEKKDQTCDVFIFYCLDSNLEVYKRLIIPSTTLSGQTQIGIGQQSKWNSYIDKWNIIKDHAEFFSKYKVRPKRISVMEKLPPPKANG